MINTFIPKVWANDMMLYYFVKFAKICLLSFLVPVSLVVEQCGDFIKGRLASSQIPLAGKIILHTGFVKDKLYADTEQVQMLNEGFNLTVNKVGVLNNVIPP